MSRIDDLIAHISNQRKPISVISREVAESKALAAHRMDSATALRSAQNDTGEHV